MLRLASRKSLWGQFWSSHQRFFKYLCIAAKVRRLVELAKSEMNQGKVRHCDRGISILKVFKIAGGIEVQCVCSRFGWIG